MRCHDMLTMVAVINSSGHFSLLSLFVIGRILKLQHEENSISLECSIPSRSRQCSLSRLLPETYSALLTY